MESLISRPSSVARLAWCALLLAPACDAGGDPTIVGAGTGPEPTPTAVATGTIAYARGGQIRLVEPAGTDDHALWTVPRPELGFTVTGLVWKPDGTELAFASDHEMATSLYERDVYVVSADGVQLRKLTNGPRHEALAAMSKGTVRLRVQNATADAGPFIVYVTGAAEPQSVLVAPGATTTVTFPNVADLGNTAQIAVAAFGAFRWYGAAAADVRVGATVDAGTLTITSRGLEHLGADGPAWRADGASVAFIGGAGTCALRRIGAAPAAGAASEPLLDPAYTGIPCTYDLAPTRALAGQLLVAEVDFGAGEGHVYRMTEGGRTRGEALVTYPSYARLLDLRWLPDGSGFVFAAARFASALEEYGNVYEYSFATRAVKRLTSFTSGYVRALTVAPDGARIALERATAIDAATSDVWVMRRDGSDLRLVVRNARVPAWNPRRP